MKMVVFGAGASFDSIYSYYNNITDFEWRPPLGNEIFYPRKNFMGVFQGFPGVVSNLSYLNAINDLEEFFQNRFNFTQKYKSKEFTSELISIQFCLQRLFSVISQNNIDIGLSNYDVIVNQALEYAIAKKEDVLFVTFNYDLLLEFSLRKKFYKFGQRELLIDEYLSTPIKIIKPHGSCNWFKRFNEDPFRPDFDYTYQIFHDKYDFERIDSMLANKIEVIDSGAKKNAHFYPQLLIPYKSKDSFIMPDEQQQYLEQNLEKVNEILIIGWKGTEYKFLNLLKDKINNKSVKVLSVNGVPNQIGDLLKEYLPKSNIEYFTDNYNLIRYDNTILSHSEDDKRKAVYHSNGSFSSYILNTIEGKFTNFFAV